jgi:hypothetical protein
MINPQPSKRFVVHNAVPLLTSFALTLGSGLPARALTVPAAPGHQTSPLPKAFDPSYFVYVPMVENAPPPPPACPLTSSATYEAIGFQGGAYKSNAITDENADFRISILGFAPNGSAKVFTNPGGGGGNGDGPRFHTMFSPARVPAFTQVSTIYTWNWNEAGPPPYGSRGGLNTAWLGNTVLDVATNKGETLFIPARNANINNQQGYKALVLYAGENELTLAYFLYDGVLIPGANTGYVVHMLNFCVDPNLLALYRAQLSNGKRATMQLPAIRASQKVGVAKEDTMTIAVRDGAAYMDPRVERDWWVGHP